MYTQFVIIANSVKQSIFHTGDDDMEQLEKAMRMSLIDCLAGLWWLMQLKQEG